MEVVPVMTGVVPPNTKLVEVKVLVLYVPVTDKLSPAVAVDKVVPERCQKPLVPDDPPVILPVQVKLPVVPSMVQPVEEDPPAIFTVLALSARFRVVTVLDSRLKVAWLEVKLELLTA